MFIKDFLVEGDNMTAIIGAIADEFVLISSDRRRSDFDGNGKFASIKDEWAIKIEVLSSHVALSAAGEYDTTTKVKKELKERLRANGSLPLQVLISTAQDVFRKALWDTKSEHAKIINNRFCLLKRTLRKIFRLEKKPEDINVKAGYFLAGFDLINKKPFLFAFINGDDYELHNFDPIEFYPMGAGEDEMVAYIKKNLPPEGSTLTLKHFEDLLGGAICSVAESEESVNSNLMHCYIDKNGIHISENPKQI